MITPPPPTNWRHNLKALCQQDITAPERHNYITFLRKKLFPNNEPVNNNAVIAHLPTTTLLLLIKACQRLRDWPLIIHCGEEYQKRLERTVSGNYHHRHSLDNLRLLSRAYQQLGLFDPAEHCLQRAIHGDDHPLIDNYRQLQQRAKVLPKGIDALRADPLLLTPLQNHHEDDFLWQYADPTIRELCNLPDFNQDDEDWRQWLHTNQKPAAKHLFAVNHRHWGFIGSVGLELSRDVGFFHYWLGKNFQGQGYGPQAVTILLNWARRHLGLRCCYATTYKHNIPSRKALAKIGFQPAPLKVILPDDANYQEDLFYWSGHQTDKPSFSEINRFFSDRDFEGQVAPLAFQHRDMARVA